MKYEVGDITKGGYEVLDVYLKPMYKMRKRVTINDEVYDVKYAGESGWLYIENNFKWVELDNYPNKQMKFTESELDWEKIKNKQRLEKRKETIKKILKNENR